jgi:hypothetical protein
MELLIIIFVVIGILVGLVSIYMCHRIDQRLDQWEFYLHTHPYTLTSKKDIDAPPGA